MNNPEYIKELIKEALYYHQERLLDETGDNNPTHQEYADKRYELSKKITNDIDKYISIIYSGEDEMAELILQKARLAHTLELGGRRSTNYQVSEINGITSTDVPALQPLRVSDLKMARDEGDGFMIPIKGQNKTLKLIFYKLERMV